MNRSFWIDLIRVICTLLVIMIHVSGRIAGGYASGVNPETLGLAALFSQCFCSTASNVAVSLFVMISGGLLLGRNETISAFYRKRFGKILFPFLAWSCIFILCLWLAGRTFKDGTPITFISSLGAILEGGVSGHFWFMYMLISLYLVAPFLSVFVRNAPRNMLIYFLILWYIGVIVFPWFNNVVKETFNISNISGYIHIELASYWVGFFVAGFVLKDVVISKRWAWIALACWLFLSLASPVGFYLQKTYPDSFMAFPLSLMGKYFFPFLSCQVSLTLIAFLTLRSLGDIPSPQNSHLGWLVAATAPLTFGIYLCHHLFLTPTMEILKLGGCSSWIIVLFAVPLLTLLFYVIGAGIIYVIRLNRFTRFLAP